MESTDSVSASGLVRSSKKHTAEDVQELFASIAQLTRPYKQQRQQQQQGQPQQQEQQQGANSIESILHVFKFGLACVHPISYQLLSLTYLQ